MKLVCEVLTIEQKIKVESNGDGSGVAKGIWGGRRGSYTSLQKKRRKKKNYGSQGGAGDSGGSSSSSSTENNGKKQKQGKGGRERATGAVGQRWARSGCSVIPVRHPVPYLLKALGRRSGLV